MASITVRDGSTEDVVFTLTRDDVAYDLDGAGVITLYRITGAGTTDSIDTDSAQLNVTDANAGEVTLSPTSTTWVYGSKKNADLNYYDVYFTVVTAGGDTVVFAEDSDVRVNVKEKYS